MINRSILEEREISFLKPYACYSRDFQRDRDRILHTQPWHFIIVKSQLTREKLAEASHNQKWMMSAPVFIVCVADIRCRVAEDIDIDIELNENSQQEELKQIIRDTSISMNNILLEATKLGLGTCWVAWFVQQQIRIILNLPSDKYVMGIITLGYPAEWPNARPRKNIQEILHYERGNLIKLHLKTKFLLIIFKRLIKSYPDGNSDKEYLRDKGWLEDKNPWED